MVGAESDLESNAVISGVEHSSKNRSKRMAWAARMGGGTASWGLDRL